MKWWNFALKIEDAAAIYRDILKNLERHEGFDAKSWKAYPIL
jgi:hypothetical protein